MLAVRSVLIASAILCVAAHAQPATSHRVPTVEDGAVLTVVGVVASLDVLRKKPLSTLSAE